MCAIERHPDNGTRDSLTHTLFNLIKRPDEQQRRIIMDVCYYSKNHIRVSNSYNFRYGAKSFYFHFRHVLALLKM